MIIRNEQEWQAYSAEFKDSQLIQRASDTGICEILDTIPSYPCFVLTDIDENNVYHYVFEVLDAEELLNTAKREMSRYE